MVASGQGMEVDQEIPRLKFCVSSFYTSARFLVAPVPYPIILGSDWLQGLGAVWDFGSGRLYVRKKNYEFELELVTIATTEWTNRLTPLQIDEERRHALMESVTPLRAQAASLVRKQPKRYKNFKTKPKCVPIKELIELAQKNGDDPLADPSVSLFSWPTPSANPPPGWKWASPQPRETQASRFL